MEHAGRPATAITDGELVRQARSGRRAAFDALVERYQRRGVAVAVKLLGNTHDALEVTQDAFVRAYRGLDGLEDVERFGPWFLRIVSNLSLNFRRSRGTGPRRVSFEDCLTEGQARGELISDQPHSEDRPGALLAAEELREKVQAALAALPDAQRMALVLFSMENMPQKDVAEIMECSVEAVKWHVFQARKKLKEHLVEFLS